MTLRTWARGASALVAACMLTIGGASAAAAQVSTASATVAAAPTLPPTGNILSAPPSTSTTITPAVIAKAPAAATAAPVVATHTGLWPLVWANMSGALLDEELSCIATAVYFEARGEPFDGQLAVAEVVMNRAYSGRYPPSYCAVVKQPWQFSFVRGGRFPPVNTSSASWAYAQAITRIAKQRLADKLPDDVLWYHADYVAPVWGRRLSRVEKIGAHIFYRA
ncbi:MAG: Cell_wall_hydrolase_CwlJ [uncultured Sphingomonas sp.]|uniref:Cell_wall_hydrolase_CwlJ n=1 Tax=uncultured Sphingomonas sp. TaxID=158754 RepID=A0A6J4TVZ0_9SPHN|nr:cell wall hydrolase [uncultured Sphingomonas sp.]CAA9533623.1 MAG: Cell_wall_hydrolase_CwlJ [uncultured Sphingomonas sp.]